MLLSLQCAYAQPRTLCKYRCVLGGILLVISSSVFSPCAYSSLKPSISLTFGGDYFLQHLKLSLTTFLISYFYMCIGVASSTRIFLY